MHQDSCSFSSVSTMLMLHELTAHSRVAGAGGRFHCLRKHILSKQSCSHVSMEKRGPDKTCCLLDLAGGPNHACQACKSSCFTFWTVLVLTVVYLTTSESSKWFLQFYAVLTVYEQTFSCLCELKNTFTWFHETVQKELEETSNEIKIMGIWFFSYSVLKIVFKKVLQVSIRKTKFLLKKPMADTILNLKGLI